MDLLRDFLKALHDKGVAQGNLLGLLHVLIGRRITLEDGTEVSAGLSWRDAAGLLKRTRWDADQVAELGVDPAALPPRDRQRYWFLAISQAGVHSPAAWTAGEKLAKAVKSLGYVIGPAPGAPPKRGKS
jgi:hypothetical protein